MRVQENIVRAGYFWLPENPDHQVPGTLTIRDGGETELEVVGNFDVDRKLYNESWSIPRIVGHVEKDGLITLDDCHYRTKCLPMGSVSKSVLWANRTIVGAQFAQDEPLEFNTFQFSVEGLEEWVNISGVKIEFVHETKCADISYVPPDDRVFKLSNGMTLSIAFAASLGSNSYTDGARITERIYLKLESAHRVPLDTFTGIAMKLTNLLCFAVDATVCIKEAKVTCGKLVKKNPDGSMRLVPLTIFYPSIPHSDAPSKIQRHSYLFSYEAVDGHFDECVTRWLDAYEEMAPSVNLYFSAKSGGHRYLEPKFLALAQAIETLHRRSSSETLMPDADFSELLDLMLKACPEERKEWLNGRLARGNELPLRQRLSAVTEPFIDLLGGAAAAKKVVKRTTDTRNYLTHYDSSLKSRAAHGTDLAKLAMQLEALLELHFLQRIGFSGSEIRDLAHRSHRFSQKLKWPRER